MASRLHHARSLAHAVTSWSARRLGYDLRRSDDFYSPLPELESLPDELWREPATMHGIDLGIDRALDLLEGELRAFLEEFSGPRGPLAGGYQMPNSFYGSLDSAVLHAIVRWRRPARVVELGSGNSSLLIAHALECNRADGFETRYQIFDPFPFHGGGRVPAPASAEVSAVAAQRVPLAAFEELGESDVLFVDTTHTVKTGGDVTRIVLEVLPALRPGVTVHFHDVFLPYEYPRSWLMELQRAWAEQYLLQAFLAYNAGVEVVMPCHAVSRSDPERVARIIAPDGGIAPPAAFWIQRR